MKIQKILFVLVIACCSLTACKNENKETVKTATIDVNKQNLSIAISGMTCEIGCAKTIESKLSKKEGVLAAKVIFKDSIANIEYDANKLSKKDLVAFVDGIAGGELYKATVTCGTAKKSCKTDCKNKCCTDTEKKTCKGANKSCDTIAKKPCSDTQKKICKTTDKKTCDTTIKKECKAACDKACCANKK